MGGAEGIDHAIPRTATICFFQGAIKFKTRYVALGFTDGANLDQGDTRLTIYALKKLADDEEARISTLGKKAVG